MTTVGLTPTEAGREAMDALGPMLNELDKVKYLDETDPRRVAALAEKQRVLDLIARSEGREPMHGIRA